MFMAYILLSFHLQKWTIIWTGKRFLDWTPCPQSNTLSLSPHSELLSLIFIITENKFENPIYVLLATWRFWNVVDCVCQSLSGKTFYKLFLGVGLWHLQKGTQPADTLTLAQLDPFLASDFQKCKKIHSGCFKPLNLW